MSIIPTAIITIMFIDAAVLLFLMVRHTDRFGENRGPMPVRTRNVLMWVGLIAGAALTFWETQHGNTNFYHPKIGAP